MIFRGIVVFSVVMFCSFNILGQINHSVDIQPNILFEWEKDVYKVPSNSTVDGQNKSYTEDNISNTFDFKESELHAAINPINPDNKIIVYRYKDTMDQTVSSIYFTLDNGDTWSSPTSFNNEPSEQFGAIGPGGDPVVTFDQTGKAYMAWMLTYTEFNDETLEPFDTITHTIQWAESIDGGANWVRHNHDTITKGKLILASPSLSILEGQFTDKEWLASVPSGPNQNDLISIYFSVPPDKSQCALKCRIKKASNDYFEPLESNITPPLVHAVTNGKVAYQQFPSLCVNSSNEILVGFLGTDYGSPQQEKGIYFSKSNNNGLSFDSPIKVSDFEQFTKELDSAYLHDNNLRRISSNMQIASDNSGSSPFLDNIYMVWNATGISGNAGNGIDIYFSKSTDGGISWSTAKRINNDTEGINVAQYLPSIYVTNNGTIVIGYYDRRNQNSPITSTDYFFSVSKDGGTTFSDIQVNSLPSNFSESLSGSFSVGDYVQILADDHFVYPIWVDGRSNDKNLDIYFAKVDMVYLSVESIEAIGNGLNLSSPFPNPTDTKFEILGDLSKIQKNDIKIIDESGKTQSIKIDQSNDRVTIDIEHLAQGTYFLSITQKGRLILTKKIIKQ